MPELPEIEAIKRVIEPQIKGFAVQRITVNRPEVVAHPSSADEFCTRITGQFFTEIDRRGKFLILCLNSGDKVVLHLRMTGCLLVTPADYPEEKHTHLVFHLSGGRELRFSDTRRFGRFWLLRQGEADTYTGMEKLGAEPFEPGFSGEYLSTHLGKRKKAIKECLLDQNVIAGIGNIYSVQYDPQKEAFYYVSKAGTLNVLNADGTTAELLTEFGVDWHFFVNGEWVYYYVIKYHPTYGQDWFYYYKINRKTGESIPLNPLLEPMLFSAGTGAHWGIGGPLK